MSEIYCQLGELMNSYKSIKINNFRNIRRKRNAWVEDWTDTDYSDEKNAQILGGSGKVQNHRGF